LEQGFAPRLSRVTAGMGLLLFPGAIGYFFGRLPMFALLAIPVLLGLPVLLLWLPSPRSLTMKTLCGRVSRAIDPLALLEWLEQRFQNLKTS